MGNFRYIVGYNKVRLNKYILCEFIYESLKSR